MRIRQPCDVTLNQDLGRAIRRHGVERSGLVKDRIPCRTVGAARGGEDKALHPGRFS